MCLYLDVMKCKGLAEFQREMSKRKKTKVTMKYMLHVHITEYQTRHFHKERLKYLYLFRNDSLHYHMTITFYENLGV